MGLVRRFVVRVGVVEVCLENTVDERLGGPALCGVDGRLD